MALGMSFTLAFLPVGLIVFVHAHRKYRLSWRTRAVLVLATGAGFLAVLTGRLGGHLREPFRDRVRGTSGTMLSSMSSTHEAIWLWLWVNPLETVIALGVPAVVWCVAGFLAPRSVPLAGVVDAAGAGRSST